MRTSFELSGRAERFARILPSVLTTLLPLTVFGAAPAQAQLGADCTASLPGRTSARPVRSLRHPGGRPDHYRPHRLRHRRSDPGGAGRGRPGHRAVPRPAVGDRLLRSGPAGTRSCVPTPRRLRLFAALLIVLCTPGSAGATGSARASASREEDRSLPAEATVRVTDARQLLEALGPDRVIELAPGTYDLSSSTDVAGPHLRWEKARDGLAPLRCTIGSRSGTRSSSPHGSRPWRSDGGGSQMPARSRSARPSTTGSRKGTPWTMWSKA